MQIVLSVCVQNNISAFETLANVDYTLVLTSAPLESEALFFYKKHTVYEYIGSLYQSLETGICFADFKYFLKGVPGVAPYVEAACFGALSQLSAGRCLQIGLAAREGETVGERIGRKRFVKTVHSNLLATVGIPGVGVVTFGTMAQTALSEDYKAKTGTINYGILNGIRYAQENITHRNHRCRS